MVHDKQISAFFYGLLKGRLAGINGEGDLANILLSSSYNQTVEGSIQTLKSPNFQICIKIGNKFASFHEPSI